MMARVLTYTRGIVLPLTAVSTALAHLAGCAGNDDNTNSGPGGPSHFGPQPPIAPSGADGTLGSALNPPHGPPATPSPSRVMQAVAGERHLCVLDSDGKAWCRGDTSVNSDLQPNTGNDSCWGLDWKQVSDLPTLSMIFAAEASSCGTTLQGGLWCWGPVAVELPEVVGCFTARPVFDPPMQPARLLAAQGPWSFRVICAITGFQAIQCQRPQGNSTATFPGTLGDAVYAEGTISALVGTKLHRTTLQSSGLSAPEPAPNTQDFAALSRIGEMTCGLTPQGQGHCWPGIEGPDPEILFTLPSAKKLIGGCAIDPNGSIQCGLPSTESRPCPLGLLRAEAIANRGCGPKPDGSWICFGRPFSTKTNDLENFTDQAQCPIP